MAAIATFDPIDSPDTPRERVAGDVTDQVDAAAVLMRRIVTSLEPSRLDASEALGLLGALTRLRGSVDAATALVAGRVEACRGHETTGHRSTAHYLAEAAGTTITRANELVETGKRVASHAATDAALRSGAVSVEQANVVTSAAAVDPSAETELLARAQNEGVKRLADRARSIRLSADDDRMGRYRRQHASRSLKHGITDDGMVWGKFELPPDTGAMVVNTLEREADRIFRSKRTSGGHEAHDRYVADALLATVTGTTTTDGAEPTDSPHPGTAPPRPAEAVVLISYEALLRGRVDTGESCMIQGVGPIPVERAREIAADAFLKGVLVDGTDVMRVKHFGRKIPAAVRTALEVREVLTHGDVRCTSDGCDATLGLEWDHVQPVARDGPTSYENMQPLCRPHHRTKTRRDGRAPP